MTPFTLHRIDNRHYLHIWKNNNMSVGTEKQWNRFIKGWKIKKPEFKEHTIHGFRETR
jgi:hypothetical protein